MRNTSYSHKNHDGLGSRMAFGSRGSKRSGTNQTVTSAGAGYQNDVNSSIMDNTEAHINNSVLTNEETSSLIQNPYTIQVTGGYSIASQNSLSPDLMKNQAYENTSQTYIPSDSSYVQQTTKAKTTEKPHASQDPRIFRDSNNGPPRHLGAPSNSAAGGGMPFQVAHVHNS